MGKRNEWSGADIAMAMEQADNNLSEAAKLMNSMGHGLSKVTRQNLQTWVNEGSDERPQDGMDNADMARKLRAQQNANAVLRREVRNMTNAYNKRDTTLQSVAQAVAAAEPSWPMPEIFEAGDVNGRPITIEILFSDLQVGKLMTDYDSKVAERRVDEWCAVVSQRIQMYKILGYHVEKIVLAVLGDIIESDKKHDNSGRACDIGTADQMRLGQEWLFGKVIKGLALFAVPLDVVMITGNHDHDGHGLNMFKPGREHLSWPMYHAVRLLTEAAGIDATFYIPEGSFHVHEIYGQRVLYEHGVGVSTSGAALKKHVGNRIDQLKEYITFFRMGDKHNISRFNNDRHVVNGAFFGDSREGEEYSGIAGYDGEPAQLLFAHVERSDNFRTSIFDSLAVQLGHIK